MRACEPAGNAERATGSLPPTPSHFSSLCIARSHSLSAWGLLAARGILGPIDDFKVGKQSVGIRLGTCDLASQSLALRRERAFRPSVSSLQARIISLIRPRARSCWLRLLTSPPYFRFQEPRIPPASICTSTSDAVTALISLGPSSFGALRAKSVRENAVFCACFLVSV
jgi:hypothetical protein